MYPQHEIATIQYKKLGKPVCAHYKRCPCYSTEM